MVADDAVDPRDLRAQAAVGVAPRLGQRQPQRRDGGLQSVRQVGRARPRGIERGGVVGDQRVELGGERAQLGRLVGGYLPRAARPYRGDRRAQRAQRPEPQPELDDARQRQRTAQHDQRQRQRCQRLAHRPLDHRARHRHRQQRGAARRRDPHRPAVHAHAVVGAPVERRPARVRHRLRVAGRGAMVSRPSCIVGDRCQPRVGRADATAGRVDPPARPRSVGRGEPGERGAVDRAVAAHRAAQRDQPVAEPVVQRSRHEAFQYAANREAGDDQRQRGGDQRQRQHPPVERCRR